MKRHGASVVHSEFGSVPQHVATPSSGGSGTSPSGSFSSPVGSSGCEIDAVSALRKVWLEVQGTRDEARQRTLLVPAYEAFVAVCGGGSGSVAFRQMFGDGSSLMSVLCRVLCADARMALKAGVPTALPAIARLLDSQEHMVLLSYFAVMCDPSFFTQTTSVSSGYEAILHIVVLHSIPSILAALHKGFLDSIEHGKRDVCAAVTPQMAAADQKYLALIQTLITPPAAVSPRGVLADLNHSNSLMHVAETLPAALLVPFWASGSISELAAALILSVIANKQHRDVAMVPRVIDAMERCLMDGVLKEADASQEEYGDHQSTASMRLATLVHILSVLYALRRDYRSAQNYGFDFGLVVTVMLSLQSVMGTQRRTTERLLSILEQFATLPLPSNGGAAHIKPTPSGSSRDGSAEKPKKSGGFSLSNLTSQLSKFVGSVVSVADSSIAGRVEEHTPPVTATQVLECMSLFVVCAVNEEARLQVAQRLLTILQRPHAVEGSFFVSLLTAMAEAVPSFSLAILSEYLQAAELAAFSHDACSVMVALSRKLLDVDNLSTLHMAKLIAFFTSLGSRSHTVGQSMLQSGVIRSTTRLVEMLGVFGEGRGEVLHNIAQMWAVALKVSGSVAQFDGCATASVVLKTLLVEANCRQCVEVTSAACTPLLPLDRGGSPSQASLLRRHREPSDSIVGSADATSHEELLSMEVLSLLRDAFSTLVGAKRETLQVLLDRLLAFSGRPGWSDEVSVLLCAFSVSLADNEDAVQEAIRSSAIELCLSLFQGIDQCDRIREETELMCSCLSAMLPFVRFSEVGRMLSVSIPASLVGSTVVCQFLADLALGSTRDAFHANALIRWYDHLVVAKQWRSSHPTSIEPAWRSPHSHTLSSVRPVFPRAGGSRRVGDVFVVPLSSRCFCEVTFPLLELCRWYHDHLVRDQERNAPASESKVHRVVSDEDLRDTAKLRVHTTAQLAELVHAVSSRLSAPLNDPHFSDFVLSRRQFDLLPFVADVTASPTALDAFFLPTAPRDNNGLGASLEQLKDVITLWHEAVIPRVQRSVMELRPSAATRLLPPHDADVSSEMDPTRAAPACGSGAAEDEWRETTRTDFPHYIQFYGGGGAFGHVEHVGDDGWPNPDGYSVALWCWWSLAEPPTCSPPTGSSDGALKSRDSAAVVPIWSCRWTSTDPSAAPCSIALMIDLECSFTKFVVTFNGDAHTVELPLIPRETWTHVVVAHQRNKLFPSSVCVYMDGALVKKVNVVFPLTALTQASGFNLCKAFNCVLGFDKKTSLPGCRLRLGPFQVYQSVLVLGDVMSLFAAPVHNLQAGRWGAHGDICVSSSSVVLDRSSLNYLAAAAANDLLEKQVMQEKVLSFAAPSAGDAKLIVAVHPAVAVMTEASFRYLDNHEWALINTAFPSDASLFVLQGPHSEPTATYVDAAHALVAHGATTEWLSWLAALIDRVNTDNEDVHQCGALAQMVVNIIAACAARVSVKELRHRAFYYNVALQLLRSPALFFSSTQAMHAVSSFYCTLVHADGAALGSKVTTSLSITRDEAAGLLLPVISNTAAAEMIFCNAEALSRMPLLVANEVLSTLRRTLSTSNRYCRLNAARLMSSGFCNAFLYGLCREYVNPRLLPNAVHVVTSLLLSSSDSTEHVAAVMTFLAATVPHEPSHRGFSEVGRRMGSKLAAAASEYVVLVRNMLLRGICEMLAAASSDSAGVSAARCAKLVSTLADSLPLSWVYVMTNRYAHPTTVALSLQIVFKLMHNSSAFKSRAEKANINKILISQLVHHSHQQDVTSLLMHAYLGHDRNVLVYQQSLIDDSLRPNDKGLPYLMHVIMFLQKSNAISARDPMQIAASTSFYEQIPATAYFAQISRRFGTNNNSTTSLRSKLKRIALTAWSACVIVGRKRHAMEDGDDGEQENDASSPAAKSSTLLFGEPQTASRRAASTSAARVLEDECVRRKDLVARVLNWVSIHFLKFDYVACSMFNPAAMCASGTGVAGPAGGLYATPIFSAQPLMYGNTYPIDFVAWILVCALGNMDDASPPSASTAETPSRLALGPASAAADASPEQQRGGDDSDDEAAFLDVNIPLSPGGTPKRIQCQSFGLDELPSPAHEAMFQACCNIYVGVIEQQVRDYVALYVGKQQGIKTSPFTLVLHHILATCPQGIGDAAEGWFHAAVISLWLQTTSRALQRYPLTGETGHHLSKNCVSIAQYTTERLVSGLPTPPNTVLQFLITLLGALQYADHLKQTRHLVVEWLCFALSPVYHEGIPQRLAAVRDVLHTHKQLFFGQALMTQTSVNTTECHKYVLVKLLDLSSASVTDYLSTKTPGALRLADVWSTVLAAYRNSPALPFTLAEGAGSVKPAYASGPGSASFDFLHGGIDILSQSIGGSEMFLSWLADNRYSIQSYVKSHPQLAAVHDFRVGSTGTFNVNGRRHLKWAIKTVKDVGKARGKWFAKGEEALLAVQQSWQRFQNTVTFVDPNLLKQREFARPDVLVVRSAVSQPRSTESEHDQPVGPSPVTKSYWRSCSGIVAQRTYPSEAHSQSRLVELGGEPVGVYMSCPPPSLIQMISGTIADYPTASGNLKASAAAVVERIIEGGAIQPLDSRVLWIGNVYYILGTESIVCTLTVTRGEVVLISHSQVTTSGDFFITQIRPHAAVDRVAKNKRAAVAVQEAIARFLPRQASALVNAAATAATGVSISTYRHSQYYRQLRTEALQKDLGAFVWRFPIAMLTSIHHRRFQHQAAALEFCMECESSHFVVLLDHDLTMSKTSRQSLLNALSPLLPLSCSIENNKSKQARVQAAQKRWIKGTLSTMEYLKTLNDAASRTTADLTQYPVMPWILQQYDEPMIDLSAKVSYRDLTRPMGAAHPANAAQVQARYHDWPDDSQPAFHYGTHYSTSAVVLYYMIRLEPFHQWSVRYQGGRLDVADRLFHSVSEAWASSSGAGSDVKELIPEVFTSQAWALNTNRIALGVRRDGVALDDVVLPTWACGRPEVFSNTLAEALEGDVVSGSIHHWIDLVFGFKQRGEESVKAVNVFHHLSYDDGLQRAMESAAEEEDRKAIVASVDNFGLTPKQLFSAAHPKRSGVPYTGRQSSATFLSLLGQCVKKPNLTTVFPPSSCHAALVRQSDKSKPAARPSKIVAMQLVDSVLHVSTATAKFTAVKPLLVAHLEESTGCITVGPHHMAPSGGTAVPGGGASAAVASSTTGVPCATRVLPCTHSFGVGRVVVFTISPCGNIVAGGTDHGAVVVFSRSHIDSAFSIANFLYPSSSNASGRVRLVHLCSDGQLVVASEPGLLTSWYVGHKTANTIFTLDLQHVLSSHQAAGLQRSQPSEENLSMSLAAIPNVSASVTVRAVSRDERRKHLYCVTDHHILAATQGGLLLAVVPILQVSGVHDTLGSSTRSSGSFASAVTAQAALQSPMTGCAFVEFTVHSQRNVLIVGHANGCITFWVVHTLLPNAITGSASDSRPYHARRQSSQTDASSSFVLQSSPLAIRSISFHSCIAVDKALGSITCLLPVVDISTVVVGFSSGGMVTYALPHVDGQQGE